MMLKFWISVVTLGIPSKSIGLYLGFRGPAFEISSKRHREWRDLDKSFSKIYNLGGLWLLWKKLHRVEDREKSEISTEIQNFNIMIMRSMKWNDNLWHSMKWKNAPRSLPKLFISLLVSSDTKRTRRKHYFRTVNAWNIDSKRLEHITEPSEAQTRFCQESGQPDYHPKKTLLHECCGTKSIERRYSRSSLAEAERCRRPRAL